MLYIDPEIAAQKIALAYCDRYILHNYDKERIPSLIEPDLLEDDCINVANIYSFVYESIYKQISGTNLSSARDSEDD